MIITTPKIKAIDASIDSFNIVYVDLSTSCALKHINKCTKMSNFKGCYIYQSV